nr:hypothetical protein [Anatilimnocola aggregata]
MKQIGWLVGGVGEKPMEVLGTDQFAFGTLGLAVGRALAMIGFLCGTMGLRHEIT